MRNSHIYTLSSKTLYPQNVITFLHEAIWSSRGGTSAGPHTPMQITAWGYVVLQRWHLCPNYPNNPNIANYPRYSNKPSKLRKRPKQYKVSRQSRVSKLSTLPKHANESKLVIQINLPNYLKKTPNSPNYPDNPNDPDYRETIKTIQTIQTIQTIESIQGT